VQAGLHTLASWAVSFSSAAVRATITALVVLICWINSLLELFARCSSCTWSTRSLKEWDASR
jgi:hypothetical protein